MPRRQHGQGRRQVVPQLLQFAAQKGVVEHKATIILHDAQPLTSAVGAGVEDAGGVDAARRVGRRLLFSFHRDRRPRFRQDGGFEPIHAQANRLQAFAQLRVGAEQGDQQQIAGHRGFAGQLHPRPGGRLRQGDARGPRERQRGVRGVGGRRRGAVAAVGVPVEAGLDGQHGGAALVLGEEAVQPVGRLHVTGAGSAGEAAGVVQCPLDGGGQVGSHGNRLRRAERRQGNFPATSIISMRPFLAGREEA